MDFPGPDDDAIPLPPGRIDIHSHLLPGIDDGCENLEQSFESVRRLKRAGFIGSFCTPHLWHEQFPQNTPENIRQWTKRLAVQLANEGIEYHVWPGGELRLYPGVIDFLKAFGAPTLADSRCVLVDLWVDKWPKWVPGVLEWMVAEKYQPILAHPERIACYNVDRCINDLAKIGVLFQGNTRCLTGEEGFHADRIVRELLETKRYTFFALDMHRPDALEGRLDGMALAESEFGVETLDRLMSAAPRKYLLEM